MLRLSRNLNWRCHRMSVTILRRRRRRRHFLMPLWIRKLRFERKSLMPPPPQPTAGAVLCTAVVFPLFNDGIAFNFNERQHKNPFPSTNDAPIPPHRTPSPRFVPVSAGLRVNYVGTTLSVPRRVRSSYIPGKLFTN